MSDQLCVKAFSTYIPQDESDVPPLDYLPSIFKRRLSQLTKMTIQAVHDVLDATPDLDKSKTKLVFGSFRGELAYAFKVNNLYAGEQTVMPASFTLSVHNAAIAEATIAFGLTGGYATVFPKQGDFYDALLAAAAPILSGDEQTVIFAFGDERICEAYKDVPIAGKSAANKPPFAFAAVLTKADGKPFDLAQCKGTFAQDFMALCNH